MTFETLKKNLKDRINGLFEQRITELDVNDFMNVEMILFTAEMYAPDIDATKAFLLFQGYSLIGDLPLNRDTSFLIKAKRNIRQFTSQAGWNKALKEYEKINAHYRMYLIEDYYKFKIIRNTGISEAPDRDSAYLEYLSKEEELGSINFAPEGTYQFDINNDNKDSEKEWVELKLPEYDNKALTNNVSLKSHDKTNKEPITLTLAELTEAAEEMHRINKDDYCAEAMTRNKLKAVTRDETGSHVANAAEFTFHNLTNMVGMVGSGKSTFMKVASFALANKGKKVILILETVADVLQMCSYFKKLGLSASPLLGRSSIVKRIGQMTEDGEDFFSLPEDYSKYLCNPCLLMNYTSNKNNLVPLYGKEPCKKLKKKNPDGTVKPDRYTCPYVHECPSMRMERELLESSVVVTTIYGLAQMSLTGYKSLVLRYVIDNADVVMVDECDKIQSTLDEMYVTDADIDDFRRQSDFSEKYNKVSSKKLDEMNRNLKRFYSLCMKATDITECIRRMIAELSEQWKAVLNGYFCASTMFRWFEDTNKQQKEDAANGKSIDAQDIIGLSDEAIRLLEQAMWDHSTDPVFSDILKTIDYAVINDIEEEWERANNKFEIWLNSTGSKPSDSTIKKILLYLAGTRFDSYMRELNYYYTYSGENESDAELFEFLQSHFAAQQKILPSFVLGNLFGMKCNVEEHEGLMLYRLYSMGRTLMNRLPWLSLTDDNLPAGPHVLLMSGSSWAPDCLQYNVNAPIDYILEVDDEKKAKFAQVKFFDFAGEIRVSGKTGKQREEALRKIILKSKDPISGELERNEGKLLMIVGSYKEAKIAAEEINKHIKLFTDNNIKPLAAYMIRDISEEQNIECSVKRSAITRFEKHPARILVAPANAIGRGYNIVDKEGHSVFGSLFFLVRPIPIPDDFAASCSKLCGLVEREITDVSFEDTFTKADIIRKTAYKYWGMMEHLRVHSLSELPVLWRRDLTATVFILIIQVFGRLCRITDYEKSAPRVYFIDGAFRAASKNGYDLLNELHYYLDNLMTNNSTKEIAETLYGGFYSAFKEDISIYDSNHTIECNDFEN